MSLPTRAPLAHRSVPAQLAYHVELSPTEVLERLKADPDVQVLDGFPARGRSDRKFLVELGRDGFRVCQNTTAGTVSARNTPTRPSLDAVTPVRPSQAKLANHMI